MIWRGRDSNDSPPPDPGQAQPTPDEATAGVGGRIESILDAAERAAVGIREDAQEWAGRYIEESRRKADEVAAERIKEISALTDSLVARARQVAAQSDELIGALDDAGRRMANNARPGSDAWANHEPAGQSPASAPPPGPEPPAAQAPPAPPQAVPKTQAERPPAPQPSAPAPAPDAAPPSAPLEPAPPAAGQAGPRVSEGARLLATQMAVAGSTRDEISWRLREEFGIQDSSAILREIGI